MRFIKSQVVSLLIPAAKFAFFGYIFWRLSQTSEAERSRSRARSTNVRSESVENG